MTVSLSVVVPLYCEEDTIDELYSRLRLVLKRMEAKYDYEIVFVNDGSTDLTLKKLEEISLNDPHVKVLSLSRNFGHQKAITAGIDHAFGKMVVLMDGDLQDPPEVIPKMVEQWEKGHQVVYGTRTRRKGETFFKLITAKLFYSLIQLISDTQLVRDSGDFRLLDQSVVEALREIREENRYLRGLVSWVGFSQVSVSYERDERFAGNTKFTFRKMLKFAFDGITGFSEKPLQLSIQLGAFITISSFALIVWLVAEKILYPEHSVSGWTSVMVALCAMGGIQLLAIGVLGEYIGRIYRETKERPLYIVAKRYGYNTEVKSVSWKNR